MTPLCRVAIFAACFASAGSLNACKDFLTAQNPGAVAVERLEDSSLVDLMHNSAIAGLQGMNNFWYSYLSATFTDELRNHHVFIDEVLYDQRRVDVANSYNSVFTYGPIQRARWLADSVAGRMRTIYADSALHDVRLARVYAIAGYQLIRLAEGWCEVPISTAESKYSAPVPSIELFKLAEARFDSAIKIAAAARTANAAVASTTLGQRYMLASDSIRNLAYVGKARAALGRNDKVTAAAIAQLVAPIGTGTNFEYRMYYNSNLSLGLHNLWAERLAGGAGVTAASISNTPFLALDDARVPHPINATTGAPATETTQSGAAVVPNSPLMFSTFSGTKAGADPTYETAMVLASLLEAKYIIAEAEGPTATNIAFIESRRLAFPSITAATPTTVDNYMTNLIEQRGRDFFLDGHRIGDLRRWSKYAGISNRWPTGAYLGSATVTFGSVMCWPLNAAEITNNPLVPKPYTPPLGP
ncbi:MAG: hypothetical protein ABIW94_00145 [Gemmatimonadaceae bacterium]